MASTASQSLLVDAQGLAELREKRIDLLLECEEGPDAWAQEAGPFTLYERRLEVTQTGDEFSVTERYEFQLGIKPWSPLLGFLMKRALLEDSRKPHHRWWWAETVVSRTTVHLLSVLTVISIIAGYLGVAIGQTITFVANEFSASDTIQGDTLAAVRIGVVISTVLIARADRFGRRPLILAFTAASLVFTALTALSTGMLSFGILQGIARGFDTGLLTLITLSATEEVPASVRALSVSLMAMCSALGAGMVVWVLPVADVSVGAWRVIYVAPLLFLPVLWWAKNNLPETRRFSISDTRTTESHIEKRRFALIALSAFAAAVFLSPSSQLLNEYLRDEQSYSAASISLFRLVLYTPAGLAVLVAGVFADRIGRRLIGALGMGLGTIASALAYFSDGTALWLFTGFGAWLLAAAYPALRGYQTELFPTKVRAKVGGWIDLLAVSGSAVGLVTVGRLSDRFGSLGPAFAVLAVGPMLVVLMIIFLYPETAAVELEEFNPNDPALTIG